MQRTESGAASRRAFAIASPQISHDPYVPSSSFASARATRSAFCSRLDPTPTSVIRVIASVVPSPIRLPNPSSAPRSGGAASLSSGFVNSVSRSRSARSSSFCSDSRMRLVIASNGLMARLLVVLIAGLLCATSNAAAAATITKSVGGDDWSLPAGAPAPNSGFYSERESADAEKRIDLRGFDLTWRQIQPAHGSFDANSTGSAEGLQFPSFAAQNSDPRAFWMRLFASGTTWAPAWVAKACSYTPVGPDYDNQMHLPIWDPCVWGKLRDAWRTLMIGQGLRADPRLRFVYVPGAFTWSEFDYDMIDLGARKGLTFAAYRDWHTQMVHDLVSIMDGENDDPSDDYAYKLVYTGEDYPFSDAFGDDVDFFA